MAESNGGKENRVVINLNNIRAKKHHTIKHNKEDALNHILLGDYYEKITKLIADRINEIEMYKDAEFDIGNINEVKMHDAILIYGNRGNGKSTIMINLDDFITGKYRANKDKDNDLGTKVKVFETIDPTIQEEDEDFLLVILSTILKEVENHAQGTTNTRDAFYDSLEKVLHIVEATRSKKKDHIDIFDKFYGLKSGVGLAEELHNLFKHTKDIFEVKTLIIPIDDVDMNLKQGYQIADSIRKYMSSPYIIPIVAFNIKQMSIVTRYHKYKEFSLPIDTDLDSEELSFLKSLPNDYLAKIFPPNRRVYLQSIFEIMKSASEKVGETNTIYFHIDKERELTSFDMISLITELYYEFHYGDKIFENVDKNAFLSNRSMRNFLNDCYCVLSSLKKPTGETEEKIYEIDKKVIKDRLAPDDMNAFVTKQHALTWLWNEYIDIFKKNLDNNSHRLKNYNWARIVTEILPEDHSPEVINKKSYARVWLQEYYVSDERILQMPSYEKDSDTKLVFKKACSIAGALELAMRSYIPMYLFETLIKTNTVKPESTTLIYLRNFATKPLLDIAYELSTMEIYLSGKNIQECSSEGLQPIGALFTKEGFEDDDEAYANLNIPFLFKVSQEKILQPQSSQAKNNKSIYILSIFKAIALFTELLKIHEERRDTEKEKKLKVDKLLENYEINIPNKSSKEIQKKFKYKDFTEIFKTFIADPNDPSAIDTFKIDFQESSFGVFELTKFSKRLIEFFMQVRQNIECNEELNHKTKQEDDKLYQPLITYYTSFAQALFISLLSSINKENVLTIKMHERDEEGEKVYTKNSLYGTKNQSETKNSKKKITDHLYEYNIEHLKKAAAKQHEEKSDDIKLKMQCEIDRVFEALNGKVEFFNGLLKKADFFNYLNK
jgi:hypothetical protein